MTNEDNQLQRMGGAARAKKLSPDERQNIARTAAHARWEKAGKVIPKAIYEGILTIGDIEIP